jgi:glycine cleavage system H protein
VTVIRGFDLPNDLYYLVEKHVWVKPMPGGTAWIGMTPVGYHLLRNSLVAISLRPKMIGQEVAKGRSIAMIESLKYIGPVPAPFTGVLIRGNEPLAADPTGVEADPYGAWIVEMRPADWEQAKRELLTGEAAIAAYRALLDSQNISAT